MHDDQWDDEFPDDGYDYSQHFYDPNKNGVEYDFRTFFIPSEKAKRGIKDLLTSGVLERDLDYVDEEERVLTQKLLDDSGYFNDEDSGSDFMEELLPVDVDERFELINSVLWRLDLEQEKAGILPPMIRKGHTQLTREFLKSRRAGSDISVTENFRGSVSSNSWTDAEKDEEMEKILKELDYHSVDDSQDFEDSVVHEEDIKRLNEYTQFLKEYEASQNESFSINEEYKSKILELAANQESSSNDLSDAESTIYDFVGQSRDDPISNRNSLKLDKTRQPRALNAFELKYS